MDAMTFQVNVERQTPSDGQYVETERPIGGGTLSSEEGHEIGLIWADEGCLHAHIEMAQYLPSRIPSLQSDLDDGLETGLSNKLPSQAEDLVDIKWQVDRKTAEYLRACMNIVEEPLNPDALLSGNLKDIRLDEPLLVEDHHLMMNRLKRRNEVTMSSRLKPVTLDKKKRFPWSRMELAMREDVEKDIWTEKLDVDRSTALFLRQAASSVESTGLEGFEAAIERVRSEKKLPAVEPVSPPLVPMSPSPQPEEGTSKGDATSQDMSDEQLAILERELLNLDQSEDDRNSAQQQVDANANADASEPMLMDQSQDSDRSWQEQHGACLANSSLKRTVMRTTSFESPPAPSHSEFPASKRLKTSASIPDIEYPGIGLELDLSTSCADESFMQSVEVASRQSEKPPNDEKTTERQKTEATAVNVPTPQIKTSAVEDIPKAKSTTPCRVAELNCTHEPIDVRTWQNEVHLAAGNAMVQHVEAEKDDKKGSGQELIQAHGVSVFRQAAHAQANIDQCALDKDGPPGNNETSQTRTRPSLEALLKQHRERLIDQDRYIQDNEDENVDFEHHRNNILAGPDLMLGDQLGLHSVTMKAKHPSGTLSQPTVQNTTGTKSTTGNIAPPSNTPALPYLLEIIQREISIVVTPEFSSNHTLVRSLQRRLPSLNIIERDPAQLISNKHLLKSCPANALEADLTTYPGTGIVITTLQKLKQKPLPGQASFFGILDRITALASRYERLVVLISEGRHTSGNNTNNVSPVHYLDEADCITFAQFTGSVTRLPADVQVKYIAGGHLELVEWIAAIIVNRRNSSNDNEDDDEAVRALQEETTWERFLRKAGLDSLAAQAVLHRLKPPDGEDMVMSGDSRVAWSEDSNNVYGLNAFVRMSREERIRVFGPLMGGDRVLSRVSHVIDGQWESLSLVDS